MSSVPRAARTLGVLAAVAGVVAGCGSSDFANDPRPPYPFEVSASIDNKQVTVSPNSFGAGLAIFTVANLSSSPANLTITGPVRASTGEIQAGGVSNLKVDLSSQGTYHLSAGPGSSAAPATLKIGPERQSPQNKVGLP